ncbi:response regulator [Sulfurimonas sp. HSL-1716]|uniref:response regulator n=1 Tax=Hydrocurvibacter sulfurireducens TaxID=3131937 RepID=UPI0031F7C3E9
MIRLLIIEDEWIVANFIADVAISQHCRVAAIVESYQKAKEFLFDNDVDCAIVDINLKGPRHGIDVAHMLNEKKINFLFLTAYKDKDTIKEATGLKPLSYLIKPASEEEIIAALSIAKNNHASTPPPTALPFSVDAHGMILHKGEIIPLSGYERIVFAILIKNYRSIVPRETFFEMLWEHADDINDGTLRNIIFKLRKRFDLQIESVRNIGYSLISF